MTFWVSIAVILITCFAAFGQTVAGFGFSLLAVPPLSMVIDPKDAIAVSLILLIGNSAMLAWGERSHIEWEAVRTLLASAAFGLPFGFAALAFTPVAGLQIALAVSVLFAVALMLSGVELERQSRTADLLGGFFCGVLTTSLNTPGPPAVLAIQTRKLSPEQFRPTTSAVLGLASLAGAVLFLIGDRMTSNVGQTCLVAFPATLVGWRFGLSARRRIPPTKFRVLILVLLVAAALMTLVAVVT